MADHSVFLEPFTGNKSRRTCPQCGKRYEFALYIDGETKEPIADHVGRCNRELNCGYHYTPKQYYQDNPTNSFDRQPSNYRPKQKTVTPDRLTDYLPMKLFDRSLANYDKNYFYTFLVSLFAKEVTENILLDYFIGTSHHWPGAVVFWQADISGKLRQAKIMLYNPETGRRVKSEEQDYVYFAGKKILNNYEANLQQCFYGEYALSVYPDRKIAIVESEKTAIIASVYFPQLIWLATGGSHGCKWTTHEVCKVLAGKQVILFPDLGFYEKWQAKADQVMRLVNCQIIVSDLLEKNATEEKKKSGWDLADYLLMNRNKTGWALTTEGYPLLWDIKQTA